MQMSWPLVWVVPFRTVVRRVEIAGQIGRRNGHLCAWRYGKGKISWKWNVVSASSSAICLTIFRQSYSGAVAFISASYLKDGR